MTPRAPAPAGPDDVPARRRRRLLAGAASVLVLTLAACSGGGADQSSAGSADAPVAEAGAGVVDGGGVAAEEPGADADADRQVVQTGTASVAAADPLAAADGVVDLVEAADGRVDDLSRTAAGPDGSPASAVLTVRVPADRLTDVLDGLEELGDVTRSEVSARDVTGAAQDLDARIGALEISVARMQDLLSRATTNADIIAAEAALTDRQSSLEGLRSERARLADQVSLSTLTVSVGVPSEDPVIAEQRPRGFGGGLAAGWDALLTTLGVLLVLLGILLPWLLAGALVVGAVLLVVRRRRRTRPATAPAAPEPAPVGARGDGPGSTLGP